MSVWPRKSTSYAETILVHLKKDSKANIRVSDAAFVFWRATLISPLAVYTSKPCTYASFKSTTHMADADPHDVKGLDLIEAWPTENKSTNNLIY